MQTEKVAALMLLGFVVYTYFNGMPDLPVLSKQATVGPREDLGTGSPFKDGANYQPAAESGSGKPPRYTSYQFQ